MPPEPPMGEAKPDLTLSGHVVQRAKQEQSTAISDPTSQLVALFLASLALLIHEILVADGVYGSWFYLWLFIEIVGMLIAAWLFRRHAIKVGRKLIVSPILVFLGLFALLSEWCSREFFGAGQPFEIVTMSAVRNLVWGLAIVSVWSPQQRLSVTLSLFLAMFGMTASRNVTTQWLAGLFGVAAVVWLVVSHWENVRRRLEGREQASWPRWAFLIPILIFLAIGIGVANAERSFTTALRGFLPSSGGVGDSDPYARDGVGDGEMLVAGTERIQSFAPIEDAPFMQDDQPSLYDLFDDTYEESVKVTKTQRAIALPPELQNRVQEHLHHRTEKANREFSTRREMRDPTRRRHVNDVLSDAILYVAGRVPLHLRSQVYDLFDGETWYPAQSSVYRHPLEITMSDGKPWLQLNDRGDACEFLGPGETHALKVVRMDSNVIPAPLYLHGVHIDLVDRADMFAHGPDGLIAMDRKTLPSQVPIHLASRPIDWHRLSDAPQVVQTVHVDKAVSVIPANVDQAALRELAQEWCQGENEGWDQITAIKDQLRLNYVLDEDWRPESSTRTGVEQFLFESHRGPDYQFATAAALMLRSLGYSTRVVSGFYASPENYNRESRHTPVFANDVHVWTEIRVSGGDWITVEATPGYEVLGPPPGILQRVWIFLVACFETCRRHWIVCTVCLGTMLLIWWQRRKLRDRFNTLLWQISFWRKPHDAVLATLRLLRQRAQLANNAPRRSITHHQWLGGLIARSQDEERARLLYELRREIDVAAYSRSGDRLLSTAHDVCRNVVDVCSFEWFQKYTNIPSNGFDHPPPVSKSKISHVEHVRK